MVRVHDGLTPKPLPMDIPEPRLPPQPEFGDQTYQVPQANGSQGNAPQMQRDRSQEDPVESLLRDLLGLY